MSRPSKVALNLFSFFLIAAGILLVAVIFFPQLVSPAPTSGGDRSSAPQPPSEMPETGGDPNGAPNGAPNGNKGGERAGGRSDALAPSTPADRPPGVESGGPADKGLRVTIPEMNRVENNTVPSTTGDDERALKQNVAIHLRGTGYPWQREANVYLAGHRIGYPGTDSFMGFYDLNKLEEGDRIKVSDSEGERYTYRVFRARIVKPSNTSVTEPIAGRNILTLQTCTLPDYTQRLIVQAERVSRS